MAISYRDRVFCSVGDECANRHGCPRWYSPEEQSINEARVGLPVSFGPLNNHCPDWQPEDAR